MIDGQRVGTIGVCDREECGLAGEILNGFRELNGHFGERVRPGCLDDGRFGVIHHGLDRQRGAGRALTGWESDFAGVNTRIGRLDINEGQVRGCDGVADRVKVN